MLSRFRLRSVPLLFALAVLLFAPTTAGAVGWVGGPALSPAGRISVDPLVAITPSGERIVAWEQRKVADRFNADALAIAVAPSDGPFGAPQVLPVAGADDESLTAGADGTVALVWSSGDSLHIARRAPGDAGFTEAPALATPARIETTPAVAIRNGDIDVAFDTELFDNDDNTTTTIQAARLAAGSATIAPLPGAAMAALDQARSLKDAPDHTVAEPSIAVADDGTVHVAWEDLADSASGTHGGVTTVRRASLAPGGAAFGAPIPVDMVADETFFRADDVTPRIVAGGGRVDLAWSRSEKNQIAYEDVAAPPSIQTIETGTFPFAVRAGLDAAGELQLSWQSFQDAVFGAQINAAIVAPGATVVTPAPLTSANGDSQLDAFVTGADGHSLVVVDRARRDSFGSSAADVQASMRVPGGPFGDLEDVSGPQDRLDVASFDLAAGTVGSGGSAAVAWSAHDGSDTPNERIFSAQRDATAPTIGDLTVPATAAVGTPVALAAAAGDALSPVTIDWDFGDGSQARGAVVDHAYGAPGTYTVTVTATDGAANAATRTATVAVPGPSGPGGSGGPLSPTTAAADHGDRTPPVIARLTRTHARFRVAGGATATIAAHRRAKPTVTGTTFKLTLDERATLILDVTGKVAGRRSGADCVAGATHGRACTLRITPGTLVRAARGPGAVSIPFSGRIGAARLAPGSYTASVSAIDAAGNRSRPRTVAFTVVSR